MTTTRTAPRSAELLGIHRAQGDACQDCGRELSARLFVVRVRETGEERHLGRRCAAKATGYPTTRVEHEALAAERRREQLLRHAEGTVEQYEAHLREVNVLSPEGLLCVWTPEGGTAYVPVAEAAAEFHARMRVEFGIA